jgi:glycine betaine/choline ABC-type transport system substrate-binding protein
LASATSFVPVFMISMKNGLLLGALTSENASVIDAFSTEGVK